MSWKEYKLKEICSNIIDCVNKTAPTTDEKTPYKMLRTTNIRNGVIYEDDVKYVTKETFDIWTRRGTLKRGDILFTREAPLGEVGIVKNPENFFLGQRIVLFRVNSNICDNRFILYSLLYRENKESIIAKGVGSTVPHLRVPECENITLKIPDLAIQKKIADILSAYDELIENNNKQIKLLEEAAQRLYKEWFIDLRFPGHESTKIVDGVPEGWTRTTLGNIIEIKYGKDHKSISDGDIPVYGSGGEISYCSQYLYDGESILIPRKGSLNNILYVNKKFWTVDTMFYSKILCPQSGIFTYFCLKSFDMYSMNIGAAVPSMTINILKNLKIILPNPNILKKFQAINKNYFQKIDILIYQKKKLMQSRDKLLGKMMNYSLITDD